MKLVYENLSYEVLCSIRERVMLATGIVGALEGENTQTFDTHLPNGEYVTIEVVYADGAYQARCPALIGTENDFVRMAGTPFNAAVALREALHSQMSVV